MAKNPPWDKRRCSVSTTTIRLQSESLPKRKHERTVNQRRARQATEFIRIKQHRKQFDDKIVFPFIAVVAFATISCHISLFK
jgi:hypothetical protein